jgi:hypothetical protein
MRKKEMLVEVKLRLFELTNYKFFQNNFNYIKKFTHCEKNIIKLIFLFNLR